MGSGRGAVREVQVVSQGMVVGEKDGEKDGESAPAERCGTVCELAVAKHRAVHAGVVVG